MLFYFKHYIPVTIKGIVSQNLTKLLSHFHFKAVSRFNQINETPEHLEKIQPLLSKQFLSFYQSQCQGNGLIDLGAILLYYFYYYLLWLL